jgi:hypothetical protein
MHMAGFTAGHYFHGIIGCMNMPAGHPAKTGKPTLGRLFVAGITGGIIAAGFNVILLLMAGVFEIEVSTIAGTGATRSMAARQVVLFSMAPAAIGTLLYFALMRITGKAAMIFTTIAVIVVLLSLLPILGQPLSPAGMVVLALMHIVAGGVITYWLTRRTV